MKVIFYSINTMMKVPNFASELDLMKQHQDAGDEVYILRCQGELKSCLVNRQHWSSICYQCQTRFSVGMKLLGIKNSALLEMAKNVDYSPLPEVFNTMDELLEFSAAGVNLGEGVVASIAAELKDHKFDTQRNQSLIRTNLETSYLVAITVQHHLDVIKPDRVYLYNGRLAETRPVLNTCLKQEIPVYCVERAGTQGKYELYKNTIPLNIDYWTKDLLRLWQKNPTGQRETVAKRYFEERRKAQDQGERSFVKGQESNLLPKGFDKRQWNVAIFITSEYEIAGYPPRKNPIYLDQNQAILQLSESLRGQSDVKLWVRMHPNINFAKNRQLLELQDIDQRNLPNLQIIWPSSTVDTYALMDASNVVLTFGSTVGVEATYWGKPSILAGKAYYENLDVSYIARSHEELVSFITVPLKSKPQKGALIFGHGRMTNGEPFKTFCQTGLHEGHFMGETFTKATLWQKQKAFLLRKIDKYKTKKIRARNLATHKP